MNITKSPHNLVQLQVNWRPRGPEIEVLQTSEQVGTQDCNGMHDWENWKNGGSR